MAHQDYRQLIIEGLEGLPQDTLAEITYFVYSARRRVLQTAQSAEETLQSRVVGERLDQPPCNDAAAWYDDDDDYFDDDD